MAPVSGRQEEGLLGRMVGGMIRRSVKKSFRNVYWDVAAEVPKGPVVLVCNHHGWFDGYVMFHVVTSLGKPSLDWIEEFGAFPLFSKIGGMPFPRGEAGRRAATVRETIRRMNGEGRSLVLFAEGVLHPAPEILPFGKSLGVVARHVKEAEIVPVAIRYEFGMHERPEAFVRIGASLGRGFSAAEGAHGALVSLYEGLRADISEGREFDVLAPGTASVNERLDMRKFFGGKP